MPYISDTDNISAYYRTVTLDHSETLWPNISDTGNMVGCYIKVTPIHAETQRPYILDTDEMSAYDSDSK